MGLEYDIHLQKESFSKAKENQECKVLVLYTGGTIGMKRNDANVYTPYQNPFWDEIRKDPRMHDQSYTLEEEPTLGLPLLVLPKVNGLSQVHYCIYQYDPLIDSSNMSSKNWLIIANDIYKNYKLFDGFVVLHGTDTLTYTASILSFLFENLGKPVIVTGSQIPIFEVRSDGSENFMNSLIIAGNFPIPEVCIFFHNKLLRGNRAVKYNSSSFEAFTSPSAPPLAEVGIRIDINYSEIFYPSKIEQFRVHSTLNENVGILRIFPNISIPMVQSFLNSNLDGIILETYGAGNFPSNRTDILYELKKATSRGVLIVNCSQCCIGYVTNDYECGKVLQDIGILPGYDITVEAALTKLSYVLGKDCDHESKIHMLSENLRGEISLPKEIDNFDENDLIDTVCRAWHISNLPKHSELLHLLITSLLHSTIIKNDMTKLKELAARGDIINRTNHDLRSALHIACCEGNETIVKYLLLKGAIVHVKDRYGKTPLLDAILNDHHNIIILLKNCGAHLHGDLREYGDDLCKAAGRGLINRIESYYKAGLNLNQPDICNRTALHVAVLSNQVETVKYLLGKNITVSVKDLSDKTPLDYATMLQHDEIATLLEEFLKRGHLLTENGIVSYTLSRRRTIE